VTYDTEKDVSEFININDDKVKDRWSRYIGAMGIEAVAKQAESTVLVVGIGAVGIEICKNIVLSGCKELIIADQCQPIWEDLCGQFFLTEAEVLDSKLSHKTRADYSKHKLQQLNSYVKVTNLKFATMQDIINEVLKKHVKVVVILDCQR
jgi:molybdopterin/thiamine biosynthesis adenylyltransferase